MKGILSARTRDYVGRIGILLVMVALVVGMPGCEPASCTGGQEPNPPGEPARFNLTMAANPVGGGTATDLTNASPYRAGTVVSIEAVAASGYRFDRWSAPTGTFANATAPTTNFTMPAQAVTITANFIAQYKLAINSTNGGTVTSPGEGTFTYDAGTVVNLVAEAEESYHFAQWTGDVGTIANVSAASTTITMNGHYSITANFILFAGGSGTAEDPYQIADWRHLDNVRNYLDAHFILVNDLDSNSAGYTELASPTANDGKGWQPIGTTALGAKFAGSFDGQGHEICDLFIARPGEAHVGLFGVVAGSGVIENVGVVDGNVTGKDNVGGLVGKNEGTVSDSYSTGSVTGNSYVGGLVGKNEGTVSNSYSTSNVAGNARAGGLVGQNSATVSDSYSTGSVAGNSYVGGLVGKNEGPVSNSYSTGSVTGTLDVGGLVGKNENTVSNSFWDIQTSGQETSSGGTGKTTAEMMDIDTFTGAAWDIIAVANPGMRNTDYIWNIVDDESYPFLSWQSV